VLSAPAIRVRRSIQADRGSPQIDAAVDAAFSGSFSGPFFLRAILISAGDRGKIPGNLWLRSASEIAGSQANLDFKKTEIILHKQCNVRILPNDYITYLTP
jgi:hypothetical protein